MSAADVQGCPPVHGFQPPHVVEDSVPLIVDLDRTLCRSDTMHEALIGLLASTPTVIVNLPLWLSSGKEGFKSALAGRRIVDPALLPYDEDVLRLIARARAEDRRVELISASDQRQVSAVADHLGLFDEAVGTGSDGVSENLSGQAKADYLVSRFGTKGFDYIGDSAADIPVWAAARQGYGVRVSSGNGKKAQTQGVTLLMLGESISELPALLRACRPHQWAKNLLILLPVLTAHDLTHLPAALLGILCFSLAASAIYIINDLVDLPSDRQHPRKRFRPFASGKASAKNGLLLASGLLAVSVLAAVLFLPATFFWTLMAYVVATTAYSFSLKRKMMVDVLALAALYTLRIVAGSAATGIILSPWLLVFSMFLFFALATIKRQAELEDMLVRGSEKTAGRNMMVGDLPILRAMSISASQAAVLVFALYSKDPQVQEHFRSPDLLLLICPVLFFWLGRMQLLTRRGHMTDDPIVFTFHDRVGLVCGALMLTIFVLAVR